MLKKSCFSNQKWNENVFQIAYSQNAKIQSENEEKKMKRLVLAATLVFSLAASVFSQADLQPLAVVKLNRSETITLRQLRSRVEMYQKQNNIQTFTIDQKKEILAAMIDEKLITQAAVKSGLQVTDTNVNQYFLRSLSQQVGRAVTEAEFAEMVKANTGLSFDDFMRQQVGMNVAEYKAYLKNQLLAQQYVLQQKQGEIAKVAATDSEIRNFYEMNKASFVQSDMVKIFLILVPKKSGSESDLEAARTKANKMLNDLKDKKSTFDSIKAASVNDKTYQGGDIIISKTPQHAAQLGISPADLEELFGRKIGYISNLNETKNDFQFYVVREKYPAKMLSLSDLVQPDTTTTVYDYIKMNLTQQKQNQALILAVNDITKSLDTPENVDRKKTGDALDKLLNW